MSARREPADGSLWIEVENGHWPLDVVRVWDTYSDLAATNDDLTPSTSFYRGVVAFEIIDGRNGPRPDEVNPPRCRRIWPLISFLRDFEPQPAPAAPVAATVDDGRQG